MDYVHLGRTGVRVSSLCFGTMAFGGDADEAASAALFARCREAGINFFDCADVYASGRSEQILGELAASCRDELIITTKAYFPSSKTDPTARGASRRHLLRSLEASLRRLRTDRIDVFFVHRFDEGTDLHETLRALDDLVAGGKVLYTGASNFAAWQVAKALGISAREGWAPFSVIQPMYNLVKRQAEVELLPMARAEGLGAIPYSPLGGGLLTGKYEKASPPTSGRLVDNAMYVRRYGDRRVHETARELAALAEELGCAPASLAVAWVGAHPAITAPIIGARNVTQLEDSLRAVEIDMNDELYARIGALWPEPPPATDRNEERDGGDPMAVVIQPSRQAQGTRTA
ncbi:MAG: aldo/keto reductase [Planctomycetota bacterium]|jgi:aryl-alcohol dehydrogenase-like predicted oxidoreductase